MVNITTIPVQKCKSLTNNNYFITFKSQLLTVNYERFYLEILLIDEDKYNIIQD
jgi:hypothetical protein